jgi:hypothetical protein
MQFVQPGSDGSSRESTEDSVTALVVSDRKPEEEQPLSPMSIASLSPMRYAKRSSAESLIDDSPIMPVSPWEGNGKGKTKKRRRVRGGAIAGEGEQE